MAQENYDKGCSIKRPPLLEPNGFWFWKARFETYVKSKDIDLWQVIQNGDFYYEVEDSETKLMKETPYELLEDDQKKKLGNNNEAKMTLYNALPLKNCKIDLLTQKYEKFSISNEETIDSGFTRFIAIVTSLKSLDPDYSSKNHIRKFLHALPLKWRAKMMAIKEAKDLATLPLDELVENLKVDEMILKNDGVVSKTTTKDKVKFLALKAKVTREQTSDDIDSQDGSDEGVDEEEVEAFNLMARNFRKFFRKGHFASECRKPKENKAFVSGAWSDSEDNNEHQNDATCLMAIKSQEVMIGNRRLFTLYKTYDGGHVVFESNLKGKVVGGGELCDDDCAVSFTKVDCTISKMGKMLAKGHRRNGLYTCKSGDNFEQQIFLASVVDNLTLQHRRLGHANKRLRWGSKSLKVDVGLLSRDENRLEHGTAHKSVIVRVSYDFRGLQVSSSHREGCGASRGEFTPLETIRRLLCIIGSRSLSRSKGRPSSWREGYAIKPPNRM
nr:hypothetical protein [Tanacetum cinerariifolium]